MSFLIGRLALVITILSFEMGLITVPLGVILAISYIYDIR